MPFVLVQFAGFRAEHSFNFPPKSYHFSFPFWCFLHAFLPFSFVFFAIILNNAREKLMREKCCFSECANMGARGWKWVFADSERIIYYFFRIKLWKVKISISQMQKRAKIINIAIFHSIYLNRFPYFVPIINSPSSVVYHLRSVPLSMTTSLHHSAQCQFSISANSSPPFGYIIQSRDILFIQIQCAFISEGISIWSNLIVIMWEDTQIFYFRC